MEKIAKKITKRYFYILSQVEDYQSKITCKQPNTIIDCKCSFINPVSILKFQLFES